MPAGDDPDDADDPRTAEPAQRPVRTRREPPRFRTVAVVRTEPLTPRLVRVTVGGDELAGLIIDQPAASVRLLVPPPGSSELVMPRWNGNEFLLPGGDRPTIRTLTPRRLDPAGLELDVEVVVHGGGALSAWVGAARPGVRVAVSGPGRGYDIDRGATDHLLAGDETAIPAISQLLELLPPTTRARVIVEAADPAARLPLPRHPGAEATWHDLPAGAPPGDALVDAVARTEIGLGTRVWVAGEAAAVQRIRRLLFQERGLARSQTTIRGYWKQGRSGDGGGD
jgi:NADPH-dependent ferric siderophore reductase